MSTGVFAGGAHARTVSRRCHAGAVTGRDDRDDLPLPRSLIEDIDDEADESDAFAIEAGRAAISRREWIATLPDVVHAAASRWGLRVGEPYQPGGVCAWVAPARAGDGSLVALKVAWQHDEARDEAEALRVWDGDGAVRLLAAEPAHGCDVLLLEACVPGTALDEVEAPEAQDEIVAGLLRRLWGAAEADSFPWRPLAGMCAWWADEYESRFERADPARRLDAGLSRAGIELFRELPCDPRDTALLCTDLHAANVLAAEREPWLAIDPKPYVGDPAYDVLQHMLNHRERLLADPVAFAARMAGLCDLDAHRVKLWLFARCVQESLSWLPEAAEIVPRLAP